MPGEDHRLVKIGAAARMLGISEATLRMYERMGLVAPRRSEGGTRLYDEHALKRLMAVRALSEAGLSLEDIRALAEAREACPTGDSAARRVGTLLHARREDIRRRRERLQLVEEALEEALALVARCRGCGNKPSSEGCPDCPLNQEKEATPLRDLIWE